MTLILSYLYKIENKVTSKVYIGKCKNFRKRKNLHLWLLRKGEHHSIKLQRSYNKYGEGSFKFKIIEKVSSNEACLREIELIRQYDSYNKGYNCTPGGEVGDNKVTYWKGKFGKDHNTSKKVYQYSKEGVFIQEWTSRIEVVRSLGVKRTQFITLCCNGVIQTAYGFRWYGFYQGPMIDPDFSKNYKYKKIPVLQIDPNTDIVIKEFPSATEAIKSLGKIKGKISLVCRGNRNTWNGYKWKYKETSAA